MLVTSWLLSAALVSAATPNLPSQWAAQPFRPMVEAGTAVHGAALPDASLAGFLLTHVRFAMGAAVRNSATATFSGMLVRSGREERVLVRAGVVRAATPRWRETPWVWHSAQLVECTKVGETPVELAVQVPEMLPAGLARGVYELRMTLDRPLDQPAEAGRAGEASGPLTLPLVVEPRLGLQILDARATLTRPGSMSNQAVFTGRMLQTGVERRVTLRAGFVRAASDPWEGAWYLEQRKDLATPARQRTEDFQIELDAPPMLHVGIAKGAYLPRLEIVTSGQPVISHVAQATAVLTASDGLLLRHWEYTLTAPGQPNNAAIFSGTLENTTRAPLSATVRAGFQPTEPVLVEGRLRAVSYWPWVEETRISHLPPGKPTAFRVQVPVPPKMDLYLRIPSYKPAIQLLRAP